MELPGTVFRLHKAGANGCWMGRKRAFRSRQDFPARPAHEYTHVCELRWPKQGTLSEEDPFDGSLANSGDEPEHPVGPQAQSSVPTLDPMPLWNIATPYGFHG